MTGPAPDIGASTATTGTYFGIPWQGYAHRHRRDGHVQADGFIRCYADLLADGRADGYEDRAALRR